MEKSIGKAIWENIQYHLMATHCNSHQLQCHITLIQLDVHRNPAGRTGIRGRGVLGRWGPNHAADPIITRWARDSTTSITRNKDTGKPILQFVAIQRNDSGEWAIPGGMVDPDENFQQTAQREFLEEAMDSEKLSQDQLLQLREKVAQLFSNGQEVSEMYNCRVNRNAIVLV